jgi:hypothetical protein
MPSDNSLLCLILEFQVRSLYVQQLLQAESAKEYDADWLPEAKKVMRDGTGKFAKKGASITQSIQDTTAILKQGFDLTGDTIQSLVKDPEFRKRAGLATGLPMAKLISNLATQARLNPKLTEKIDEWIANATKEFADQYGDDKSPMAQAIRKANLAQPPKDASFNEKMEFRVAQYAAYQEALKNPEDFSKRDEIIGKAAAAAIPIGVSLAIALGFEVAIPLFLAQSVNWATVLSSVAIGEAADFVVQKGMDKLEINNPALRIGASMVAGILAGGLVTGVNNSQYLANLARIEKDQKIALQEFLESNIQKHDNTLQEIADNISSKHKTIINTLQSFNPKEQTFKEFFESQGITVEKLYPLMEDIKKMTLICESAPYSDYMYHSDYALDAINRIIGFNKKPQVASRTEIDKLISSGSRECYRGVSLNRNTNPPKSGIRMILEFQRGFFHSGEGIYGNGTYVAYNNKPDLKNYGLSTALQYSGKKEGSAVMKLTLKENAKIVDTKSGEKLFKGFRKWLRSGSEDLSEEEDAIWGATRYICEDPGRLFAIMGIDAIDIPDKKFMNILNRGAVIVQDEAVHIF